MTSPSLNTAPPLTVSQWLNADVPLSLQQLRGRVVVIEAFQMLCPGCVSHGLPQAQRIARTFSQRDVAVLGLHCVFEHHEAQGSRAALEAFLHEYRITFPVAMDAPGENGNVPQTMASYELRGTPSLLLIDRQGRLRENLFGHVEDLTLGARIANLIGESQDQPEAVLKPAEAKSRCDDDGCQLDTGPATSRNG